MKPVLYFEHPVNTYDTDVETRCLDVIKRHLPRWKVENPNQPKHQEGYERYRGMEGKIGMDYFTEEVLPPCRGAVLLAFPDGKIGAGICKETDWFLERGYPVWEINLDWQTVTRVMRIPETRRLSVEETRERIRMPDGSRRPF